MSGKRKRYKILREAIWGLYSVYGIYFNDDFLVDGKSMKVKDLVLFSRGTPRHDRMLRAHRDAEASPYAHFDLQQLPLGFTSFFFRIIPKYIFSASGVLLREINSLHHTLFSNIFFYFIIHALPHEKIFSNFKITSELGQTYSSHSHIAEAIICQNHGVKYYLTHWSDHNIKTAMFDFSFLGCDQYLIWGKAHITGTEGSNDIFVLTGCPFKRFIKEVRSKRREILAKMGITAKGKIVSFFDSTFGGRTKMTGENYVAFWNIALETAEKEKTNTVVIKPKRLNRYNRLPENSKRKFIDIKTKLEKLENAYIIDAEKWSFIESIGISDVVVSQNLRSPSTLAIICGIEALYFEPAGNSHIFGTLFKDKIVFDNPAGLSAKLLRVIGGEEKPFRDIPETVIREFDAFADNKAIDRFRDILCEESIDETHSRRV